MTQGPTIEAIQRDVDFANRYRMELIKFLLAAASALFAFTVTFRPSLVQVDLAWAMWIGWSGLAVSMFGGIFHMLGWEHYYKSYRDCDWAMQGKFLALAKSGMSDAEKQAWAVAEAKREGETTREHIDHWRKAAKIFQFVGFIVGVACIALFACVNIDSVATK